MQKLQVKYTGTLIDNSQMIRINSYLASMESIMDNILSGIKVGMEQLSQNLQTINDFNIDVVESQVFSIREEMKTAYEKYISQISSARIQLQTLNTSIDMISSQIQSLSDRCDELNQSMIDKRVESAQLQTFTSGGVQEINPDSVDSGTFNSLSGFGTLVTPNNSVKSVVWINGYENSVTTNNYGSPWNQATLLLLQLKKYFNITTNIFLDAPTVPKKVFYYLGIQAAFSITPEPNIMMDINTDPGASLYPTTPPLNGMLFYVYIGNKSTFDRLRKGSDTTDPNSESWRTLRNAWERARRVFAIVDCGRPFPDSMNLNIPALILTSKKASGWTNAGMEYERGAVIVNALLQIFEQNEYRNNMTYAQLLAFLDAKIPGQYDYVVKGNFDLYKQIFAPWN